MTASDSRNQGIATVDAPCPLCGAEGPIAVAERLRDVEDRVPGEYTIAKCSSCPCVYLAHRPAPEALARCYPQTYHVHARKRINPVSRFLLNMRLRLQCRRLARHLGDGCRALLEVGCGDGSFLRMLDGMLPPGCRLTGVDLFVSPSDDVSQSRLTFVQGEFEAFPLSDTETYDAIVAFAVLEHIADPLTSLRRMHAALNPDGLVLVQVPNWDSLWRKAFPRHWQGLQVPRHQTHFDERSLCMMLDKAGFDTVDVARVYDPGDLSISLCNWIVDRLRLKTRPREVWFYFPMVLISAPIVWLVNLLSRNSGVLEVVARKRKAELSPAATRPFVA